jgi:DNA-binding NarL/FixJ family response regulator
MIRVMVVDDQQLVRTGFRLILESEDDIEVIGEACDGLQAVERVQELQPDLVLMDVRMPRLDGIEATARIMAEAGAEGGPRVVILTTFDLDEYVFAALHAGASGFLLKDTPPEDLIQAVRVVAAGDALLAPSITRRLIEAFTARPVATELPDPGIDQLTDRELEVLKLMARGLSNSEIAEELVVGEATVKTHVGRVLMKLALRDRVQAVVMAYESGLVRPGETT